MNHATATLPPLGKVPAGRVALWVVIAGELAIFGGLIAIYLLYRLRFPQWGIQAQLTSTPLGALNTMILLTSSFTVVLAHAAAQRNDSKKASNLLWLTILLGCGFLIVKSIEYTSKFSHGITFSSPNIDKMQSLYWSFYFVLTGLHALHVIGGMIALAIVALQIRKGKHLPRVEFAGLYWHMVDVIWIFLFPLLYLAH
ncbi:MAG: Cytochrome c oxidase subunit 3 [Turneriella sp.]|nr:Cytochrome c oxidase subunit 3 [Turneriella sp.]